MHRLGPLIPAQVPPALPSNLFLLSFASSKTTALTIGSVIFLSMGSIRPYTALAPTFYIDDSDKALALSRMLTAILSHLQDPLGSGHDHQADAEGEIIEVRIQSQVSTTEVTQASVPGEHACFCLRAPCPTCLLMSEEVLPHPHPRHINTTTKYNRKPSSGPLYKCVL